MLFCYPLLGDCQRDQERQTAKISATRGLTSMLTARHQSQRASRAIILRPLRSSAKSCTPTFSKPSDRLLFSVKSAGEGFSKLSALVLFLNVKKILSITFLFRYVMFLQNSTLNSTASHSLQRKAPIFAITRNGTASEIRVLCGAMPNPKITRVHRDLISFILSSFTGRHSRSPQFKCSNSIHLEISML